MSTISCIAEIKSKYPSLTKVEKRIADFIVCNSDEVIALSVGEFAARAGVAQSAVVRCCKSLGFDGYSDFKISLAMELSRNKQLNFVPYISPQDTPGTVMDKVFGANVKTLHDTAEKLDRKLLDSVVELLAGAEKIYIYAVGTSAGLAVDFQYRLMQFGFCAFCVTDEATMKISTLNVTRRDVAIGISHSGRTIATIETLGLAKKNGAGTVCLTSYPESPITKICDFPMCVYSDEVNYPVEAVSARICHMSVLDAISISLSARSYEKTLERAKENRALIDTIRYDY